MSLFDSTPPESETHGKRPLAERMRPERFEDFIGQEHILGPEKPLRRQIERDELASIILWGPPGTGKTTLAKLFARITRCEFIPFSAVLSGMKEIKAVMADAERLRRMGALKDAAPSCSSMRSIGSTRRSRTLFCPTSSAATLSSSAPPPRTLPLK